MTALGLEQPEEPKSERSWEQITGQELGVNAPVRVMLHAGKHTEGVIEALWIPARQLQAFSGEVRLMVKTAGGAYWIGPHTHVERI